MSVLPPGAHAVSVEEEFALLGGSYTAERTYREVLASYEQQGYARHLGVEIVIPAVEYTAASTSVEVETGIGGRDEPVVVWSEEESWIEWEFDVPRAGLYHIALDYYPLPGRRSAARRALEIDGSYPFVEARRLVFPRIWRDAHEPKTDNRGNHVRPRQVEEPMWRIQPLEDEFGLYAEPMWFYFEEGRHTLRFTAVREPIALAAIRVYSPAPLPTYEEVLASYRERGIAEVKGIVVKVQAEEAWIKSEPTIRREFSSDPMSEPFAKDKLLLGEFGGWRWRSPNQTVSWRFEVPEDGLYKLAFKVLQDADYPVTRQIRIDGEIPFAEAASVQFPRSDRWQIVTLGGADDPWLFYLTAGEHVLTMTVKVGPLARTIDLLEDVMADLSLLTRQITMLTGSNPDPNLDYQLDRHIPDLLGRLESIASRLEGERAYLEEIAGSRPAIVNNLAYIVSQLRHMRERVDTIPVRLDALSGFQQQLSTWTLSLREQPLRLDYFLVADPGAADPPVHSTVWQRLVLTWYNFLRSFDKTYEGVGNVYDEAEGEVVLDIWVARGREWVEILKELAEEDFTPATGIRVNMRTLPTGSEQEVLLLSAVAGEAPDIALGVASTLPVEFAIRNAAVDLSGFPDFEEVAARFRPGALIPLTFRGQVFAIPETQNFTMLFYRRDILEELGLEPPETWADVYRMIPILKEYGMEFYYGAGFDAFLYQRGGRFYTEDGLASALDRPEALDAFTAWTNLYTNYRIPVVADFYNRMRTGEMPVGVADYQTYVLLSTAAPELTGWWEMRPMPGLRQSDGTINRSIGGAGTTAMIFRQSEHPDAAWEFLKWWTSEDIQIRYAEEVEALLGVEARWNTANVEALKNLPWPKADIEAILEQWNWFQEQPVVLGGYFTSRHISNAWNRRVLEGMPAREALELAVKDINRELRRKQEEFGIAPR